MAIEWLGAAGALAALIGVVCRWRRARLLQGKLPDELADARLAYAERTFRSRAPLPLVARVDRAYRVRPEKLVLLELKTRRSRCVYSSDVIELSAQRVAVMAATGEAVADYGYVLTATPGGEVTGCHRVALLTYADVTAIIARRDRLLRGVETPRRAAVPALCEKCVYLAMCGKP